MENTQNTNTFFDSGQLGLLNRISTINKPQTKLEVLNSKQNQQRNANLNFHIDDKDTPDTELVDNTNVQ